MRDPKTGKWNGLEYKTDEAYDALVEGHQKFEELLCDISKEEYKQGKHCLKKVFYDGGDLEDGTEYVVHQYVNLICENKAWKKPPLECPQIGLATDGVRFGWFEADEHYETAFEKRRIFYKKKTDPRGFPIDE